MPQHTAGPYQVAQYTEQLAIYADNVKVATIETWIGDTERAESEANAHLLAAAPDLLAALKGMINNTGTDAIHWAIEHAQAAIAQADGVVIVANTKEETRP